MRRGRCTLQSSGPPRQPALHLQQAASPAEPRPLAEMRHLPEAASTLQPLQLHAAGACGRAQALSAADSNTPSPASRRCARQAGAAGVSPSPAYTLCQATCLQLAAPRRLPGAARGAPKLPRLLGPPQLPTTCTTLSKLPLIREL